MLPVELPKWPRLLVRGHNVTSEQAELIILRTTWIESGVTCNDAKWNRRMRQVFGVTAKPHDTRWYGQWKQTAASLGSLDLSYVHNDQISSCNADGPYGWVSWGGQVFTRGMTLLGKWPRVGEVTDDWRKIAHAFPFLDMTAQLVGEEWNDEFDRVQAYRPLVSWVIRNGAAEMLDNPGDPLFLPPEGTYAEHLDRKYANGFPPEHVVSRRRLRRAVRRCRHRVAPWAS